MEHQIIQATTIYDGRAFDVQKIQVRLPDGREGTYDLVQHPGAVTIVPVKDGQIYFVRQYRIGARQALLELPAGTLEPGEEPLPAAARETREEIGMAAAELRLLGDFFMAPGYSSEHLWVYLATGLTPDPLAADEDEFIDVVSIPVSQAYEMARSGQLMDGKSLAGLMLAQTILE